MKSFLHRIFKSSADKPLARQNIGQLYGRIVTQARNPRFFEAYGLKDDFETRFELLVLHMFLILDRLEREGAPARALSQELIEYMVSDLDRNVREAGVGDVGVVKRMKHFMEAFYGRLHAYGQALEAEDRKEILRALDRNLYAATSTHLPSLEKMQNYIQRQREILRTQSLENFMQGAILFVAEVD
jgi:cytochrome b pre-mRNA-processing protein 3